MSSQENDSNTKPRIPKILEQADKLTSDQILKFLQEKTLKDATCEICGGEAFEMIGGEGSVSPSFKHSFTTTDKTDKKRHFVRVIPTILICCANCGNTKFINTARIMTWIKSSESKDTKDANN